MIKVTNLTKKYGKRIALEDVSLHVNKGSIYGLIGSNGAGKTTLMKIMSGIYKESKGEVLINDEKIFENPNIKELMVFIPDDLYFFSQYTIRHMATFYQRIYKSFDEHRYNVLKGVFNIDVNRKISSLSKGMKRQVSFWLSLCIKPTVLILDEPLDGLDPVMRQKVKNLIIQDVAENDMTVIISSHNLREIEDICDHIGIIHKGKMIVEKDLDDLKSDIYKIQVAFKEEPEDEFYNRLNIKKKEEIGSIKTFIVKGNKAEIINDIKSQGTLVLDVLSLTLEEIFIYEMEDVGYEISNVIY